MSVLHGVPQLVREEVCLSCQGCCRFKETDSPWRPKISSQEVDPSNVSLVDLLFNQGRTDQRGYIKTELDSEGCHCTFFNKKDNTCGIYVNRPFECRIYPLLLVEKEDGIYVGLHLPCPFVSDHCSERDIQDYQEQARIFFFRPEVVRFLQTNMHLANPYTSYQNEIRILFKIFSSS